MKLPLIALILASFVLALGERVPALAEDAVFALGERTDCGEEPQKQCEDLVNQIKQGQGLAYANCRVAEAGCSEQKLGASGDGTKVVEAGDKLVCKMACPQGSSLKGDTFRLAAGKKFAAATKGGSIDGWTAASCKYSVYKGGKTRKVMIGVDGDVLQAACGPGSSPQPLLVCNTAVDCTFTKEGKGSVVVKKINAMCPGKSGPGTQACPDEEGLAACINGTNVQQFTNEVETVRNTVAVPAEPPSATKEAPKETPKETKGAQ